MGDFRVGTEHDDRRPGDAQRRPPVGHAGLALHGPQPPQRHGDVDAP